MLESVISEGNGAQADLQITIPRPAKPFPVTENARRVAIFRAYLRATELAERHAKDNRPELAAHLQREARRLLTASSA